MLPLFFWTVFFPPTGTFQLVSVAGELGKPPGIGVGRCPTVAVIMNDLEKEGLIRSHNSRLKPINFGESGRPEIETTGYIVSMQEQGEMNAYTLVAKHRVQNQGMVLPTLNPGLQYQLR